MNDQDPPDDRDFLGVPENFGDLFKFYSDFVKLVYSTTQAYNELPLETLFELNAAFDHLSRHWTYDQKEKETCAEVYSHLKRSCLDMFKAMLRDVLDEYNRLLEIDTSIIDNGEYDNKLHRLMHEVKNRASEARKIEGIPDTDSDKSTRFGLWLPIYKECLRIRKDFFQHPKIDWARKKQRRLSWRFFWIGIVSSFFAGLIVAAITWALTHF